MGDKTYPRVSFHQYLVEIMNKCNKIGGGLVLLMEVNKVIYGCTINLDFEQTLSNEILYI